MAGVNMNGTGENWPSEGPLSIKFWANLSVKTISSSISDLVNRILTHLSFETVKAYKC